MNNVIQINQLVKKYQNFQLGPLTVSIPKGMIIGLIGENGAGKTTLMKSMLGIIHPDSGDIQMKEEHVGVVLDQSFFPELLTANDIHLIMKDIYSTWDQTLFFDYLKRFQLPKNKMIKEMSKGMRKKLEIVTALSHHPSLLILDEPTSGLDPVVRNEVLDLFLEFIQDEQHTILFSTHITSDLEHISDYIIFLDQGQIVLQEERNILQNDYGILKCGLKEFEQVDPKDYLYYKKGKYQCEMLIKEKDKILKKYKNMVIDPITLEELMILTIKGVKSC
mgnify:CR=1 FL=1